MRTMLLLLSLSVSLICSLPAAEARGTRPNVLFIGVDDLNDWVGCLSGHPQSHTPRIDRLAARGTLFSNAHVQSPLCNPSRASLLTGLRPSSTGIYGLKPGIREVERTRAAVTLPQYFARHGYFTATFGKIFHDGSISAAQGPREFDVWGPAPQIPFPEKKLVRTKDPMRAIDWGVFPPDDSRQGDWITAGNAIGQLRNRPKDKPFFLAVGFRLPHLPCFASQRWFDLLPPEERTVLPPVKDDDRDDVPFFARYLNWKLPEPRLSWLRENHQWRPLVRAYLASTAFMDGQVGRLLDALDQEGLAGNTVIVLWSDHGWHLGEKGMTGKTSLWERSTRVPLIFAGPGVARGAACTQPAELLDIYPTLTALCGLPPKDGLEGQSLLPQLKDAATPRGRPAITTHCQNNHAVRSERWRYIRYADGSEELYDMKHDPNEWTNLAGRAEHKETIAKIAKWLPATNLAPAPGSALRLLTRENGAWLWEGTPIREEELEH
jgi:choline-sulfatase